MSIYLATLIKEQLTAQKKGLLVYTNTMFSYNSCKIDGSTLTFSDIETLYMQDYVITGGHSMDDIMMARNHFKLFEFMLKTIEEPLTVKMINEYHQILNKGTIYQNFQSEQLNERSNEMTESIEESILKNKVELIDILSFHHRFEYIHPLHSKNGMVGRMVAFRQCLTNNITPFIFSFMRREEYIDALQSFNLDSSSLLEESILQQKEYEKKAASFIEKQQGNYTLETNP